ncbi:polyprenyl synthetase family protein [Maritalea sp. P4.10X]|uniref:Polyprenyl synthetase family protein n=1 Tax=Maritalea mediterranea TaxID=2909667 RepID=A0ABS9E8R1_9HYPH|nr:polyprenyl synthetase family protein [Maritalea mediterranea]MCF4097846.1 polyprenyl synthetase family protein [Maritalea mediterranea]
MSGAQAMADQVKPKDVVDELIAFTRDDMESVNEMLLARVGSRVEMVPEVASYLIDAGGKRLRPMLTVAAARLFTPQNTHHINYAAAVEFMHTATLLHDDVVDESSKRRGKLAARMVWGNAASVLVGDFLLGQAFMMMVETRDVDALGVLSQAAAIIAEGEVFQLSKANDLTTQVDEYFAVIKAKTAALFEAATEVGAMAGGATEAQRKALKQYGAELGIAFQIVDDVLDYGGVSGTIGKNVGDDLREGKMTLPILHALQNANQADCDFIKAHLGDAEASAEAVSRVVEILHNTNALEDALKRAREHADVAKTHLKEFADHPGGRILIDVADYCVERAY